MSNDTILDEYGKIVITIKSYIEEQIDLGFVDIPNEQQNNELSLPKDGLFGVAGDMKFASMDEIREKVANCQACALCKTRNNVVFGSGNENARLVFVGEAPGEDEDITGEPFVGRAGQKLTQIINAINLSREEVFITNVLKCRPPNNRNPLPNEIEVCEPYLVAQLGFIKPKVICALGTFAAQTLLKTEQQISRLRGRFHTYHGIRLMPTYHPAYLLRNPKFKRDVWEDIQKVKAEYDRE